MMTSTSKIELASAFPGMASRNAGDAALAEAMKLLEELDSIKLNFQDQNASPSFADQFIGGVVSALGLEAFRRRVRIQNVPAPTQALLRHVILRKATNSQR